MSDWLFFTLVVGGGLFVAFALFMAIRERRGK